MDNKEQIRSLQESLNSVWDLTQEINESIKEVREYIRDEWFLPTSLIERIQAEFSSINEAYTQCISKYERLTGRSFNFSLVSDFEKAVYDEADRVDKQEKMCTAEEFFKLKSKDEKTQAELEEYKERLNKLITQKPEDLGEQIQPFVDLITAIKEHDIGKRMQHAISLSHTFSTILVGNLMAGNIGF